MSARRRGGQRGAAAVVALVTIPALSIVAFGVLSLGRVLVTKQRLQYAADAVAAEGALIGKRQGVNGAAQPNTQERYGWLPTLGQTVATMNAARDGNLPLTGAQGWPAWSFETVNGVEWLQSRAQLETQLFGMSIRATAATRVKQLRTTRVRRRPPTLMLVLDVSGSMRTRSPRFGKAIEALREVVGSFLDGLSQDDVLVGAVTYGTGVYDVVPPASRRDSANFAEIRRVLAKDPVGDTATGAAIRAAAAEMLRQPEDFGRNILLVSDGAPRLGDDVQGQELSALSEAAAARGAGIQVRTFEIQHNESSQEMHEVLLQMASGAKFHFEAEDTAKLVLDFQEVGARIFCDVTVDGDAGDAFAFLRSEATRNEDPLPRYTKPEDMSCPSNCDAYGYRTEGQHVILSPIACDDVMAGRRDALVRWGPMALAL